MYRHGPAKHEKSTESSGHGKDVVILLDDRSPQLVYDASSPNKELCRYVHLVVFNVDDRFQCCKLSANMHVQTYTYIHIHIHSHTYRQKNKHMGQLKLLISEIDFLTDYAEDGFTIVYAGAADGRHIPVVDSMFKCLNLRWELYDPSPFHREVNTWSSMFKRRVTLYNDIFRDGDAAKYAGREDVLFLSDIRTNEPKRGSAAHADGKEGRRNAPDDDNVMHNEMMQLKWVQTMQPVACCLKFRGKFEYGKGETFEYIDGELRMQAWPPPNSTELRLVASEPYYMREYSFQKLEQGMSYYNEVDRMKHGNDMKIQAYVIDKYKNAAHVYDTCKEKGIHDFDRFVQKYMHERNRNAERPRY
jgi:hypothetical protein